MVYLLAVLAFASVQDTIVIRADGPGVWGPITLIEEVRIGVLDGPEGLMFGRIDLIEPSATGGVWVSDGEFKNLRIFDRSGRFVREVGREGSGPGEFKQPTGLERLADGRMATWDPGLARVTIYDAEGQYDDSFNVQIGLFAPRSFAVDRAGNFYVLNGTGEVRDGERDQEFQQFNSSGTRVAKIPLPRTGEGRSMVNYLSSGPTWPYLESTRHAMSPLGYLVVGRNTTYAFSLRAPGEPVKRIERRYETVKVRRGERTLWKDLLERMAQYAPRMGMPPPDDHIPSTKPAYRDLYVDEDGRIWVDRYVEARQLEAPQRGEWEWEEPRTFDVFDPNGTFYGTVVLPRATRFEDADGEDLWCLSSGEFGERYVVRFRLVHD